MILITGGLGFIGSHTARALLDLGESCLLVQRRSPGVVPSFLTGFRAGARVLVEQADLGDRDAFLEIGRRHPITGIVHLAGSVPWPPGAGEPVDAARAAVGSLLTVVQAARDWQVPRVGVASTIGVYGDVPAAGPLGEDLPLPMTSGHVIPAFKKIGELLTDHLAGATGVEIVNLRIGAVWGPLGRPVSVFFPAPQLVHAAAAGTAPDLPAPLYADDGGDWIYVKDCGRAIALLQVAERLNHRTYNVASGRVTTTREFVAALPGSPVEPAAGRSPVGPARDVHLDITRLQQDTGYRPAYDTGRGVADYLAWLRAGNAR
jgi:UDP-glucose 4-epimerase